MTYKQDISGALKSFGSADFSDALAKAKRAAAALTSNPLPLLAVPHALDDLEGIETLSRRIVAQFRTLVVIGMGGSSLGGKLLCGLTHNPFASHTSTHVHFVDNIDPATLDQLVHTLDFKTTFFLVISKSGNTAETLSVMLSLLPILAERCGNDAIKNQMLAITEPSDNVLQRLAHEYGIKTEEHDPAIGGRYALLTCVGLLPACVAGVDIRAVRKGALGVLQDMDSAIEGAALHYALLAHGRTQSVLMPYCDRLLPFTDWYRQMWAESLGKNGKGLTPIRALGTSDQHSQLQLYLDGPQDKTFTLILPEHKGKGPHIPATRYSEINYLHDHTIGDVMQASQDATYVTLVGKGCPVRTWRFDELNAAILGALVMHVMLETILVASLLDVNAFDQPAVEESKRLARSYLLSS